MADSEGHTDSARAAAGINYAVKMGAKILNLSWGGSEDSAVLHQALVDAVNAGAIVVVAAGNKGVLLTEASNEYPAWYAQYIPGVLSVSSIDINKNIISSFSNYGNSVDLAAPGEDSSVASHFEQGLYSTYWDKIDFINYFYLKGTSMAAPIVSGIAGLVMWNVRQRGYNINPEVVENILVNGSKSNSAFMNKIKNGKSVDLNEIYNYLDKTYAYPMPTKDPCAVADESCVLPWGGKIANGEKVLAYSRLAVTKSEQCIDFQEERICTQGKLSGTFINKSCQSVSPCPHNIDGMNEGSYSCICGAVATQSVSITGSNPYTLLSDLCGAAVHAGKIPSGGGPIQFSVIEGTNDYQASLKNGIQSKSSVGGSKWLHSISF